MLVAEGIFMIFLEFLFSILIGASVVTMVAIALYFNQEAVKKWGLTVWSKAHPESYTDYKRRVEADKKFKENTR